MIEIRQGGYGSCFLVSSVIALLNVDSELLQKIITIFDNYCEAKFYLRTKRCWKTQIKKITSDKSLQSFSSKPEVMGLIEKCYAEFVGGASIYDRGGYPWVVMYDLTGKQPDLLYSTSGDFRAKMLTLNGSAMVADSKAEDFLAYQNRISPRHSYAVMSIHEDGVIMKNPWGMYEPFGDGVDDGVFKISWDDFIKCFIRVSYLK